MITELSVLNYKSIEKLSVELGRVNVFIGENGCGKSNILEAIAFASAASANKLDNEYLTARGIRVTDPKFMRSAFDIDNSSRTIDIRLINHKDEKFHFELDNDNKPYSIWEHTFTRDFKQYTKSFEYITEKMELVEKVQKVLEEKAKHKDIEEFLTEFDFAKLTEQEKRMKSLRSELDILQRKMDTDKFESRIELSKSSDVNGFLIYSPENTALRTFEKEGQIEPLGINGEGLFKLLKYFSYKGDNKIDTIKKHLKLFGWFKDFKVPNKLFEGESYLEIKDKYLDDDIDFFDQKSSNEGFLFVLFYISIFLSESTPNFFAIDNIEASLNPKLSTKLVKSITELSKEQNKQVILTTHSPTVLDGLNLNDPEQRLFVVYRNKLGQTKINRIEKPKHIEGQTPIKLSEMFLRGYLGGLPKNFSV